MEQGIAICILGYVFAGAFGFAVGKWRGYLDALPPRDEIGRFKKKD